MYSFLVFEVKSEYDFGSMMFGSKRWCAMCSQEFPFRYSLGGIHMEKLNPVYGASKEEVVSRMKEYIKNTIQSCKKTICDSVELYSVEIEDEK